MDMNAYQMDRYEYKVQYGTGIQSRIAKVHNAIENGKDATNECDNLISYLTNEVKDPIRDELKKISLIYAKQEDSIKRIKEFPEGSFKWSSRHKRNHIGNLIRKIQTQAIEEMIACIINQLNFMGLLGEKEKRTQI